MAACIHEILQRIHMGYLSLKAKTSNHYQEETQEGKECGGGGGGYDMSQALGQPCDSKVSTALDSFNRVPLNDIAMKFMLIFQNTVKLFHTY